MKNNGRIITQVGNDQVSFRDKGIFNNKMCDTIEHIITCDKTRLSEKGGNGRIRIIDENGDIVVQLNVIKGNSMMSDESSSIVLIRSKDNIIVSHAYYGVEAELDFVSNCDEYYMSGVDKHISSLKSFYESWQVKKGSIGAVVVIVDDKKVFDEVVSDSFFDNCYVLLAE